ncbi:MAG: 50S ribosomal protein L22 [Thermoplasmata archaeon]
MGYTMETDPEVTSKAYGKEIHISPKKSVEVCNFLRGKDVDAALNILDEVIEKKRAVPYRRHNKQVSHNKGVGSGGYPVNVAKKIKYLIEEAQSNAEDKGLDAEDMCILSLCAHRGRVVKGYRSRAFGRSSPFNRSTTNIEVILEKKED